MHFDICLAVSTFTIFFDTVWVRQIYLYTNFTDKVLYLQIIFDWCWCIKTLKQGMTLNDELKIKRPFKKNVCDVQYLHQMFFLHSEHCGGNGWGCEHYESFNGVIVFFYKTSQIRKKKWTYSITEPNMMPSNCLFYLTHSPQPKDVQLTLNKVAHPHLYEAGSREALTFWLEKDTQLSK